MPFPRPQCLLLTAKGTLLIYLVTINKHNEIKTFTTIYFATTIKYNHLGSFSTFLNVLDHLQMHFFKALELYPNRKGLGFEVKKENFRSNSSSTTYLLALQPLTRSQPMSPLIVSPGKWKSQCLQLWGD